MGAHWPNAIAPWKSLHEAHPSPAQPGNDAPPPPAEERSAPVRSPSPQTELASPSLCLISRDVCGISVEKTDDRACRGYTQHRWDFPEEAQSSRASGIRIPPPLRIFRGGHKRNPMDYDKRNMQIPGLELCPILERHGYAPV